MENITWKAPPKAVRYKKNNIDWATIAQRLKENPNEWAVVANDVNPSVVTHIRKGRLKAFAPLGSFEASGQGRNEDGYTKELYVRFVGESTESASAVAEEVVEEPKEFVATVNIGEEVATEVEERETASASPAPTNPLDFFSDPEL